MTITLDHIVPYPLREKIAQRHSDVWNQILELHEPQWVKVKAPSGTGKTTLVHTIWNLRTDYTGTVRYDGKALATLDAEHMARYRQQQLSVVFQDLRLFGQLTAMENLQLKCAMAPSPYGTDAHIHRMAEALGVQHVLQQPAHTCSYGEQQRIAIIRALLQPFSWLIMDEPFSHLDAANARKAAALIAEACAQRKAGFLLTDLDDDDYFSYQRFLTL